MRKCLICGEVLPDAKKDTAFCPKCLLEYEKLERAHCPTCGRAEKSCGCVPELLWGELSFSAHLFAYESDLSKRVIFSLKRKNLSTLQNFLAYALARRLSAYELSGYTVTYVPRKPKSVREYGFDQAEILAALLADALSLPMADVFSHARFSALQKELNEKERMENAEKSYSLCRGFERKTDKLLILDDVMTTGSTAKALVSLARSAGYREVAFVTAAMTHKKRI